jgi:hypothetical protein
MVRVSNTVEPPLVEAAGQVLSEIVGFVTVCDMAVPSVLVTKLAGLGE